MVPDDVEVEEGVLVLPGEQRVLPPRQAGGQAVLEVIRWGGRQDVRTDSLRDRQGTDSYRDRQLE